MKEQIFSLISPEVDHEFLQLFIDSKLIDKIHEDRTLRSLGMTFTSSITVDKCPKQKTKHSKQLNKSNGHCGLRNLGNTCYMNSALQCLSNVAPLTDYFLQHQDINGDVAQAYRDFIKNVWSDKTIFEPRQIKKSVSYYVPEFAGFDQQDAHEFITFLLNQLHIDLKQQETTSIISQLFHGRVNSLTTCLTCGHIRSTPNLISFIPVSLGENRKKRQFLITFESAQLITLFIEIDAGGSVKNLIQAFISELQLQHDYSTEGLFERVRLISPRTGQELSIDALLNDILDSDLKVIDQKQVLRESQFYNNVEQSSLQLIDCIRDFVALEMPETLWFCKNKCQRATHVAKQMKLSILPPILIVQLRRFINENGRKRKLQTFIDFPINELDLNQFVDNQESSTLYDLVAVVNHIGTNINRGHYTAYARQLTNPTVWYNFNDEHVSPMEESDIVSQDAYLLVYVKRELYEGFC